MDHLGRGASFDLTILSADVTALSADEIGEVDVVAAVVGDVAEYRAVPSMPSEIGLTLESQP